jgi:hypothetical protein
MARSKEHIICEHCNRKEWHDHCISCDKDLGEINSHHAIQITIGRQNTGRSKTEYACSMMCLKKYVDSLDDGDLGN